MANFENYDGGYTNRLDVANRAAHDINNLLVGILGYASILIQDGHVPNNESKELVSKLIDCTGKAALETQKILGNESSLNSAILFKSQTAAPEASLSVYPARKAILVIDDEEVVRNVSESILTRAGYEVFTASTGVEGLAVFNDKKNTIGCVMLDLTMPYMKGNLVFARLKAIDPDVRISVMSGYSERQIAKQFEYLKIDSFLQKPFSPEMLLNAVKPGHSERQQITSGHRSGELRDQGRTDKQ